MADWVDLIQQNNDASSPLTTARTKYVQAETAGQEATNTGIGLGNQKAAMGLSFEQQLMRSMQQSQQAQQQQQNPQASPFDDTQGGSPTATADASDPTSAPTAQGGLQLNEAAARQHAFSKYHPVPDDFTPQEQQQRMMATFSGVPGAVDSVKAMHDQRVQSQNADRVTAAQDAYDKANTVYQSKEPLKALQLLFPDQYKKAVAMGATDDQVRDYAEKIGGIVHSAGTLPGKYDDSGQYLDEKTNQPVLGWDYHTGMAPAKIADIVGEADKLDTVTRNGGQTQVPHYEAATGQSGPQARNRYIETRIAQVKAIQSGQAGPTAGTPGTSAAAAAVAPTATAAPAAPGATTAAPSGGKAAFTSPNAPDGGKLDFSDVDNSPGFGLNRTMNPGEDADARAYSKSKSEAFDKAAQESSGANFRLMEDKQMLALAKDSAFGAGSAGLTKVQSFIRNVTGDPEWLRSWMGDPAKRQFLEKIAGVDAIAATQREMTENSGQAPRMGANLVGTIMTKLNANPELIKEAFIPMVKYDQAQNEYSKTKWEKDFPAYARANKDVRQFELQYNSRSSMPDYVTRKLGDVAQQVDAARQPDAAPAPVAVKSVAEARKLPPGTQFTTPDGRTLRVPKAQ